MRISRFITIPNVRKEIAEANKTAERKVAFQRGLALGLVVFVGFLYAVTITYIFISPHLPKSDDPSGFHLDVVLPLFVILTLGFLNLAHLVRSRFDDMVERAELKMSQKEKREKRALESQVMEQYIESPLTSQEMKQHISKKANKRTHLLWMGLSMALCIGAVILTMETVPLLIAGAEDPIAPHSSIISPPNVIVLTIGIGAFLAAWCMQSAIVHAVAVYRRWRQPA